MSIQTFTPKVQELFDIASKSDVVEDFNQDDYKADALSVVIIDICGTIALDSEKWISICYADIEQIAKELVATRILHK